MNTSTKQSITPGPENFSAYWNLDTINGQPVSFYLHHPGMKDHIGFYTGDEPIDEVSVIKIAAFLKRPTAPELVPLFYYFVAHAVSLRNSDELVYEMVTLLNKILWHRPSTYCNFFSENTPQKNEALETLVDAVAWEIVHKDTWEKELEEYALDLLERTENLPGSEKQFVAKYLQRLRQSCYNQDL